MPDTTTATSPAANGVESRLALWRRSRRLYRLKICLVLAAFAVPGNAFVLFCAITTGVQQQQQQQDVEKEEENHHTKNSSSFVCYEDLITWSGRLSTARFVVEGILLTIIGGIGILGECHLYTLRGDRGNPCLPYILTSTAPSKESDSAHRC